MPIDITQFPSMLGAQLGISDFIAGGILGCFVLLLVLIPTIYLTKGKMASLYIIVCIVTMSPIIAIGWFPVWTFIIIILMIAFGFGKQIADFLGGLRG